MFIAAFYVQRIQMVSVGTQLASAARQSACAGLLGPVCLCASVLLLFHHVLYIFVLSSMSYSKDSSERVLYFCLFVCLMTSMLITAFYVCATDSNGFRGHPAPSTKAHALGSLALSGPVCLCASV